MLNEPIPVSTLTSLLPHRPPMVWVDEVVEISPTGGTCRVNLIKERHDWSLEGVRPSSLIEWMAQSYAYCEAARQKKSSATTTFLTGVRDFTFENLEDLKNHTYVLVKVELVKALLPLIVLKGTIKSESGTFYGSAFLKVYVEGITSP